MPIIIDGGTDEAGTELVTLARAKSYLGIREADTALDDKIMQFMAWATPEIEQITGPIRPRTFDEWHDGGQHFIRIRRRPSTGYGTTPILDLVSVTEFRGPTPYPLTVVQDPSAGSIYSCMMGQRGRVVRRSAGGGVMAFPAGPDSVHIVYRAGQETVPPNVVHGTLELLRENYQGSQQMGRGRQTQADTLETADTPKGYFMPRRILEILSPTRRAPSIA